MIVAASYTSTTTSIKILGATTPATVSPGENLALLKYNMTSINSVQGTASATAYNHDMTVTGLLPVQEYSMKFTGIYSCPDRFNSVIESSSQSDVYKACTRELDLDHQYQFLHYFERYHIERSPTAWILRYKRVWILVISG